MLDIQFIRDNPELVQRKSEEKKANVDIKKLLDLDAQRRALQQKVDDKRAARNELSQGMKSGRPDEATVSKGKQLKEELSAIEADFEKVNTEFVAVLKAVPNVPLDDVPVGKSEEENVVSKVVGEPTEFKFKPKTHAEIAEKKGWLDKQRAAKVTGSRFAYIEGDLVRLQFAIIQFIIDKLSDQAFLDHVISKNSLKVSNKPFVPVIPPFMIRTSLYDAMDRLEPRDDRYKIETDDLWLQGSAEHVLGSMHANETLDEAQLPLRYLGYATSFRREAGTYGKDMEGMFRMHQFDKLEMESLTTEEDGLNEHLFLIAIQEEIMQLLDIPYHVLMKCTADIGKPNARGVDIEAWLPSQGKYRETHTADYMTDYQARRLKTRVKLMDGRVELVHTNDATALPLSRGPIAIIDNYQTENGDVVVPKVLRQYIGGKEVI